LALTNQDISTILVLCKQGNQLAQVEVYNRYNKAMFNVAVRILKDADIAEDCMQEGFISAFEKLDTFKAEAPFGAWLKRIVVNKSIAQYHKNKKYVSLSETIEETIDEEAAEDGCMEEEIHALQATKVLSVMQKLQHRYQQILTLHFIEGYDYEEICEILNITNANCRTLMSRAKESLRKKLTVKTTRAHEYD
jgi:RNA polymerase sigma factor (sigma-70 family)